MNISEQLFQMAEPYTEVCFTQLWVIAIFDHKHFIAKCCKIQFKR